MRNELREATETLKTRYERRLSRGDEKKAADMKAAIIRNEKLMKYADDILLRAIQSSGMFWAYQSQEESCMPCLTNSQKEELKNILERE